MILIFENQDKFTLYKHYRLSVIFNQRLFHINSNSQYFFSIKTGDINLYVLETGRPALQSYSPLAPIPHYFLTPA